MRLRKNWKPLPKWHCFLQFRSSFWSISRAQALTERKVRGREVLDDRLRTFNGTTSMVLKFYHGKNQIYDCVGGKFTKMWEKVFSISLLFLLLVKKFNAFVLVDGSWLGVAVLYADDCCWIRGGVDAHLLRCWHWSKRFKVSKCSFRVHSNHVKVGTENLSFHSFIFFNM